MPFTGRSLIAGVLAVVVLPILLSSPLRAGDGAKKPPAGAKASKPVKAAAAEEDEIKEADQSAPAAALLGKTFDSLPVVSETGETVDIAKATKGWKVVYFWSPYCPCVKACQALSLFPLARTYRQADGKEASVSFYAIASNASTMLKRKLADGTDRVLLNVPGGLGQSPPYPILLDPGHKMADLLKARNTPQTYVFDPSGKLVFVGNPDDSEEVRIKTGRSGEMTKNYLAEVLQDALSGRAIRRPRAPALGCDVDRSDVEPVAKG
ncbi:MAG TPA: redoxin domain-containing protein [Armatimonadaceae bacterium]|nr:redoxin domain-containing protein [Armatimonadaceae bacterium]